MSMPRKTIIGKGNTDTKGMSNLVRFMAFCPRRRADGNSSPAYPKIRSALALSVGLYGIAIIIGIAVGVNYPKDLNRFNGAAKSGASKEEIATAKGDVSEDQTYMWMAVALFFTALVIHSLSAYHVRRNERAMAGTLLGGSLQQADYKSVSSEESQEKSSERKRCW